MQVQRVLDINQLANVRSDWNALAENNPLLSWEWLSSWWNAYGAEHELCVVLVYEDSGKLAGIAPWFIESSLARGRRIKFLGSGHACSDYMRLLATPEDRTRVARALAAWLVEANRCNHADNQNDHSWDFLSFEGVVQDEPSLQRLRGEMELLGCSSAEDRSLNCWRNDIAPSWEGYLAGLGSRQKRRKVKDVRRKYIDCGRTQFDVASTDSEFEEFYSNLTDLHQRRRVSLGEPGCFASLEFGRFVRTAAEKFFANGNLLLTRLLVDGNVAAASLGIESGGIHFMYQTGMNPDLSELGPGWILNVHGVLHAIENGYSAVDYLRGDEPYKERLGAKPVQMAKFRIIANSTRASLLNQAWLLRTAVRERRIPFVSAWATPPQVIPSGESS